MSPALAALAHLFALLVLPAASHSVRAHASAKARRDARDLRECRHKSAFAGTVSVGEGKTEQFGSWERRLYLDSVPGEIESRVRCKEWGESRSPPFTLACTPDERYLVGSKRTILAVALAVRPPSFWAAGPQILVIGLGGGTQPMTFRSLFPNSRVSVLEIDPVVYKTATTCFGFAEDDRTKVYITDAIKFVEEKSAEGEGSLRGSFDFIVNDVATPAGHAASVFESPSFLRHISELLSPEGFFVMNSNWAEGESKRHALASAGFAHTLLFRNEAMSRALTMASRSHLAEDKEAWVESVKLNAVALGLDSPEEIWRSTTKLIDELVY